LLAVAGELRSGLRWTLYYEREAAADPTVAQLQSDLRYVRARYARSASYLAVGGKPVIFVRNTSDRDCSIADRWKQANADGYFYVSLKVVPGYRSCSSQPDSWHQHAPARARDSRRGHSFTVSPGFRRSGPQALLPRDPARWRRDVEAMVASKAPWQLVTTFNHWSDATAVEPAREWTSPSGMGTYLDALRRAILDKVAPSPPTPKPEPGDPVIVAAGDIACDKDSSSFNGGLGTDTSCRQRATGETIERLDPAAVLALGDLQYEDGDTDQWPASFDRFWGRFKARIHPVVGNHEYLRCGTYKESCSSDETAAAYGAYFGRAAGELDHYYYSFDIGAWHLIALNSNSHGAGGLDTGSAQWRWLRRDLESHRNRCVLAYWHHPRFSSGRHGESSAMGPIYKLLYENGVDVVLTGHDHHYERTAPLDPSGTRDDARGIVNWVVGTGGRNIRTGTVRPRPYTVSWNDTTFGVLRLTLHPGGYDFEFVPAVGSFAESGSGSCH